MPARAQPLVQGRLVAPCASVGEDASRSALKDCAICGAQTLQLAAGSAALPLKTPLLSGVAVPTGVWEDGQLGGIRPHRRDRLVAA